tara:strand:+ start:937 stop:1197 length:261 start_codon:yes stop_codon:yes gene_type:complete
MLEQIKETILEALPDATVYVADPNNDGQHFEALVVSPTFEGLSLVKQHQVVMNAMKEKFETTVHAMALKTFAPSKWESEKHKFNVN